MIVEGILPVLAAQGEAGAAQWRMLAAALGLRPGEAVAGRVAALLPGGLMRLAFAGGEIEVRASAPLPAGTAVTVTLGRSGEDLRLTAAVPYAGPAGAAARPPVPSPVPPQAPGAPDAAPPFAPGGGGAAGPLAAGLNAALVGLAARGAVLPAPAPGQRPPARPGAPAAGAAPDDARAPMAAAGRAARATAEPATPRAALAEAVRAAAGRQESLAPLFADLAALVRAAREGRAPPLPGPVARAIAEVLGFRLGPEDAVRPALLARAVKGSGLFLEQALAARPQTAPAPDLKAALAALGAAVRRWAGDLPEGRLTEPATVPARRDGGPAHERPPLRGAGPQGQPPAQPALPPALPAAETASLLIERAEAALARIVLLQAASLPGPAEAARPDAPLQASLEVPLRLGQETAIVAFQVLRERDGRGGPGADPAKPAWTMRFSLDAEPLGPVHASVTWRAGHVGVALWAERAASAAQLAAGRQGLAEALEASAFAVDALTVAAGRPPQEAPARRRAPRLDRRS